MDGEVNNDQQEPYAAVYMIDFVENIRNYLDGNGGENMVMIPQNGEYIVWENHVTNADVNRYLSACDAIGVEDIFFYGNQDMNNSYNPDEERLELLNEVYQPAGWPVFSIEYLTDTDKIINYLDHAEENGFIPYCSVRDLDVLTDGFGETNLLGDVNGDGYLDVMDIVIMVDSILNGEVIENSDMNGDSSLDILDIVQLVDIILIDG